MKDITKALRSFEAHGISDAKILDNLKVLRTCPHSMEPEFSPC